MEKKIKLITLFLFLSFMQLGHTNDKSSGCGPGWKVSKRMSLVSSSTRASTNSSFVAPAITSGTSGCKRHSIVKNEFEQIHFVEENLDQLEVEISIGQGQYVEQLASLMGCDQNTGMFLRTMQKGYQELFSDKKFNPSYLLNEVKNKIRKSAELSKDCHII